MSVGLRFVPKYGLAAFFWGKSVDTSTVNSRLRRLKIQP